MPRPPKWVKKATVNGVWDVELSSWKYFHDYVLHEMLDYTYYVWRGQRDSSWQLDSSLDRLLKPKHASARTRLAQKHLDKFQGSARGRRGSNPARISEENEWWALGQHHGLATPLLDWTESPFVALYFAFEKSEKPTNGKRSVWALCPQDEKNKEILSAHTGTDRPPILEIIRPHQDENARLVNQAGLFTRAPLGISVNEWIGQRHAGETRNSPLIKLVIPETGRTECLRTLNKMNINHVTLFPDLYGAGQHCNKALQIDKY